MPKKRVTILEHGTLYLQEKLMHTADGAKTIRSIHPYKYKGCTVNFADGTSEIRQFDEWFYIEDEERDE